MIGLDRLIEIPGIIAVEQFSPDGKILRKVGEFPEEVMEYTAKLSADNNSLMESQVKKMGEETGLNFTPLSGWMIWGGKYAIFVVNNTMVIVETKRADFNQLRVDLFVSGPTGPRLMPS
jgi:roadblock/LC7 domain-containing protein